ncbi:hypothetical protein GUI12_04020 [Anaplasmataceae bacterium AB001_6]|nr:hypothetical protein GUI12_04020 [Anaplasmataceae bacterium AB001_6]
MHSNLFFNGKFHHSDEAIVTANDRGYVFGDALYEVIAVVERVPICFEEHLERLCFSMTKVGIKYDSSEFKRSVKSVVVKLIEDNSICNGRIYVQISRGEADRDHCFEETMKYVLLVFTQDLSLPARDSKMIHCVTHEDIRWMRRDIKTTSMLANIMLRQFAKDQGADEVILYQKENNVVTECASRNIFVVCDDNVLFTHPADNYILAGVTRAAVIKIAERLQIEVREKLFDLDSLVKAKEVFTTTTCHFVTGIGRVDDFIIRDGKKGHITKLLEEAYWQEVLKHVKESNKNAICP